MLLLRENLTESPDLKKPVLVSLNFKAGAACVPSLVIFNKLVSNQVLQDYRGQAPDTITGTTGQLKNWWDFNDDYVDSVAGEDGTAGASILLMNQYSEFTSRLSFITGTPVDEDNIQIAIKDQEGHATVIKAA